MPMDFLSTDIVEGEENYLDFDVRNIKAQNVMYKLVIPQAWSAASFMPQAPRDLNYKIQRKCRRAI